MGDVGTDVVLDPGPTKREGGREVASEERSVAGELMGVNPR